MISRSVSSSPPSGSVLTARSLEPVSDSVSPSLSAPPLFMLCVAGEAELQVIQPEKSVSAAAGEAATLHCTVTSLIPTGKVEWFRGTGPGRESIFITNVSDPTRRNNLDFSILISNIAPAEAGTYYCVKFQKGTPDVELKSGPGTRVFVHGKSRSLKTQPVVLRQITSSRLLAQGSPFVRPVSRQS
uniref:Ig-like domain-containing protein n=1 Tax=Lynx canadensis TaxID=61383 RepID=A0A667IX21_LYNCA